MGDIEKNTASPLEGEGLRGDGVAKWYVVHTYSGHENKVKANILKMAENRGMTELIHDIVVPTEDVVEIKDGQKKIRTKKKVIRAIVDKMEEFADNGLDYSGKCYISQSACYEDARAVADLVEQRFPKLNGKVEINPIGTTIGSHTGPGTVALFFWGSERTE